MSDPDSPQLPRSFQKATFSTASHRILKFPGRSTVNTGDVLEVSVAVNDKVEFSDEEGAEEQLIPAPRRLLHSPTEHLDGLRYREASNTLGCVITEGFSLYSG